DTLDKAEHAQDNFITLLKSYLLLFKEKKFIKYAMIKGLISAYLWGDAANFPLVVTTGLHETSFNYAIFIVMHLFWCLIGIFINYHYVTKYGVKKMLSFGLSLEVVSELGLLFICYYFNVDSVITYGFLISISDIALTLVLTNAAVMATMSLPKNKIGRANAIISFLNSALTMVFIMLSAYFFNGTFLPTIVMASFCAIIAYMLFRL
ncbi:MAG: hypothetical protein OEZ01_15585, partial [Candidatus Heimdallarchaeota archaeon]|nr:hypothetical protein [Candidatus Heimdallarchaeota archaeon]